MVKLKEWMEKLQASILERQDHIEDMIPNQSDRQLKLEIYQNAYLLRLAEALQANFPCLYRLFGEDDFGRMMLLYLRAEHPKSASIRWFGCHLSQFLEQDPKYFETPYYAEIARFEWALRHTVDARNAVCHEFYNLSALTPDEWFNLNLNLHPSVTLFRHKWNAIAIAQAAILDAKIPRPQAESSNWLVYRARDGAAAWRSLTDLEWVALGAISTSVNFAGLLDCLAESIREPGEVALTAANYLRLWVEEGILIHQSS